MNVIEKDEEKRSVEHTKSQKRRWDWEFFIFLLVVTLLVVLLKPKAGVGIPLVFAAGTLRKKAKKRSAEETTAGEQLEQELRKVVPGKIHYSIPPRMTVGFPRQACISIAKQLSEQEQAGVDRVDRSGTEQIQVGTFMAANLVGGEAFTVEKSSTEEQMIGTTGWSHWCWQVTPKKSGRQPLVLMVTILLKAKGASSNHSLPPHTKIIEVEVNGWEVASKFSVEVFQFIKQKWREIGVVGMVAGTLAAVRLLIPGSWDWP